MDTAWMVRNDGRAIPVLQHIYASAEEAEETLAAAEWLYQNTGNRNTRLLVLETIASWGWNVLGAERQQLLALIEKEIEKKPYVFLTKPFIRSIGPGLEGILVQNVNMKSLYREVEQELNQEFLRVRYGGMYNTAASSKEIVFRISSIGFDWYKIIIAFMKQSSLPVEWITIVRDEESTGAVNGYYRTKDTHVYYNQMPVAFFQKESKPSLCVSSHNGMNQKMLLELGRGKSFRDLKKHSAYGINLEDERNRLAYEEIKIVMKRKRPL